MYRVMKDEEAEARALANITCADMADTAGAEAAGNSKAVPSLR